MALTETRCSFFFFFFFGKRYILEIQGLYTLK